MIPDYDFITSMLNISQLYALNPEIMYALTNHLYSDKRKGNPRGSYDKTKE